MDAAIRCRGLRKTYQGAIHAVAGIDLEIKPGECFGLLGPNGAGKTTIIEILEGLLESTSGDVEILGCRWKTHSEQLREWVGIVLQETRFPEKLSVREIITLYASFYRNPMDVTEVIEEMALNEKADTWAGKLSGGQQQRLGIATALVGNPRVLFLDEPTSGLDPQSRRQLWEVITRFQSRNGTILLTTHYMDEAERLCDRVAVVDHGRIIACGTPATLIEQFCGRELIEFVAGYNRGEAADDGWKNLSGVDNVHNTRRPSLEDVFVRLTGRRLRED